MMYGLVCLAIFAASYLVNIVTISVLYHRGLAHKALRLSPGTLKFAAVLGNWVTGLDPKGWVCMHRLHHAHSDTALDPHSPRQAGILGVFVKQLRSYERILIGLARREEKYTSLVKDLEFDISWLNRKRVWYLPYVLHLAIAVGAGVTGHWLAGAAYFFGIMGHPFEGWLVNSFGHAVGGRNFQTTDDSRNNNLVAWLVCGEGFQNNHHQHPSSAKFSYRWWEIDPGYALCHVMEALGLVGIERGKLIPAYRAAVARPVAATAAEDEARA